MKRDLRKYREIQERGEMETQFDERQHLARAEAGNMSFLVLMLMVLANSVLRMGLQITWAEPLAEGGILIAPALGTYGVRCVWMDAYIGPRQKYRAGLIGVLVSLALTVVRSIQAIAKGEVVVNGLAGNGCIWLLMALDSLAMLIAMLLKRRKDAREEAET